MRERYFDNAATTPLDPRVFEAMGPWLVEHYGNAHSIHEPGRKAMAAIENARERIAMLLGCEPEEIFFTSGATESNNWVLRAFADFASACAVSPFEHSSVREPAMALGFGTIANQGCELDVGSSPNLRLTSVMLVNNEMGAIFDPSALRSGARKVHSDITQAAGKIPVAVDGLDFASLSAHKFYGPKGIGALYARDGDAPKPLLLGGEQEHGKRAGTLNVPAIIGMGAAAQIACDEQQQDYEKAGTLRQIVLQELSDIPDHRINGGPDSSPFILSISFLGLEGETIAIELDRLGFAVSAGAACSSRSTEPSHVLTALGLDDAWLRGTIRISFGKFNTDVACQDLARSVRECVERIRGIR